MKRLFLNAKTSLRLFCVGVHLCLGMLTVLLVYPYCPRDRQLALKQRWSRQLLVLLGVGLQVDGRPEGVMRVANHISWLDIFIINAVLPSAFVAKHEVRSWPAIGWLAARTETLFIRRGRGRDAHETARQVAQWMTQGIDLVVFPEGTTTDGRSVLPFRSALLQGAAELDASVQPLVLCYRDATGQYSDLAAYCDDTSLQTSLWRIAGASGLRASITFLPARQHACLHRRELAGLLYWDINTALMAAIGQSGGEGQLAHIAGGPGSLTPADQLKTTIHVFDDGRTTVNPVAAIDVTQAVDLA
jgi:1-acyl-sn-glycerol-3-phosphate acyltransferase